jgi:hypothetical protein
MIEMVSGDVDCIEGLVSESQARIIMDLIDRTLIYQLPKWSKKSRPIWKHQQ